MRARLIVGWLVVLTMMAAIGYAQSPPPRELSLAEAQQIAKQHNPAFLTTLSDRSPAAARSLNSAVSLFTPSVYVNGGTSWTQPGVYNLQGLQFNTPRTQSLSWDLSFNYQLSGTTLANRGAAVAQLRAADQNIAGQATTLETAVKEEYLNLLQARAQEALQEQVVKRAAELLNLAQAQYNVGQKTMIDVRQAQVVKGQADVALLQAQQNVQNEVLKLYQLMGVPAPEPPDVVPTDTFPVTQPAFDQDSLVALALRENPVLLSERAQESAAQWNVRAAYSTYLPSLSLSAGYGKFSQTTFDTAGVGTRATGTSPWNIRLGLSLPIFNGLSRHAQVSQARASDQDLRYSIRQQELAVTANVTAAYLALVTDYRTIAVQANNRAAADEALELAEEQYKVGSGSIIQLLDARVASQTAGVDYINAVYNYHKAEAALELAVGRPLQ
jgi:outer membrane protein